jgi:integrase
MACYKQSRLCGLHYHDWSRQGRPQGRQLAAFLARARQPANARVLSLRGLPGLVCLELLYVIGSRRHEHIWTKAGAMRSYVDRLRADGVASLLELDPGQLDPTGKADEGRFARFAFDRVHLAYADPESERERDMWDLRVFGRSGRLDFSPISQGWLAEAAKSWAAARLAGVLARSSVSTVQHQLHAVGLMSAVLASGPGRGQDPGALGRPDIERFLARAPTLTSALRRRTYGPFRAAGIVQDCARFLRECREMGLLVNLAPTFAIRRGEEGHRLNRDNEPGRALPAHVVAQLDAHVGLLADVPGSASGPAHRNRGVLGERAGEMAVLVYELLKGTGRRAGEVASLHLDCLDVDESARPVLIYDNHKAARMGRRLPLADASLVSLVRAQQAWVARRFPHTPRESLWLLPRAAKNDDGTAHIDAELIAKWMRSWVVAIPCIDAGTFDDEGNPVPFDRKAIHPHAFRHTYAQTLADQGVAPSVLRDLMDHTSLSATLGYFRVGEAKKRAAMELLARHTIDNRGTARPAPAGCSEPARLRDELSWVAVPFGKCAEPTNVRAGGGACPIRYQCASCPHFESDPSYLPELTAYADDLRREREAMLAMGAPAWAVAGVSGQLKVIVSHIRAHQEDLARLSGDQRGAVQEASATLRKARQSVPVAFGRRRQEPGRG